MSGIVIFLSHFTKKKRGKKDEMMFGFSKEVAFKNNLVLKKDIEEVVKCFIIFMYLNTIILLQYC